MFASLSPHLEPKIDKWIIGIVCQHQNRNKGDGKNRNAFKATLYLFTQAERQFYKRKSKYNADNKEKNILYFHKLKNTVNTAFHAEHDS